MASPGAIHSAKTAAVKSDVFRVHNRKGETELMASLDPAVYKEAMSRFPSGVVVATTVDNQGKSWGFTASSFSSVSLDPPLVLVCLAKTAECHRVFCSVQRFAISVLGAEDGLVATGFAKRGADKFAGLSVEADEHGSPLLQSAVAALTCQRVDTYECGDHDIIVGRVLAARLGLNNNPMVYFGRRFGQFAVRAPRDASGQRRCIRCGSEVVPGVPQGDTVSRHICRECGNIHYSNPTVVVGCIAEASDGRILMCRRRISPRRGFWTFPSGFLECGEAGGEGARREAFEEARADVRIDGLLCQIDVPQISEVHLVYRGTLGASALSPTAESSEVALFDEAEIPWRELAFTSIGESLRRYFQDRRAGRWLVHVVDLRTAPQEENSDDQARSLG